MSLPHDIASIVEELELAASLHEKLTKEELATLLISAVLVIRDLQSIIGEDVDFQLEAMKPKGQA